MEFDQHSLGIANLWDRIDQQSLRKVMEQTMLTRCVAKSPMQNTAFDAVYILVDQLVLKCSYYNDKRYTLW